MPPERITSVITTTVRGPAADAVIGLLERVAPWRRGTVAILTYHRVDLLAAEPHLLPDLVSATPDGFAAQMAAVAERYRPVALSDVVAAVDDPRRLPARAVMVTFDDAYADFAEHAWPVLRSAGIPATLFVPTAYPDQPGSFWWDRLWAAVGRAPASDPLDTPLGPLPRSTLEERRASTRALLRWLKSRPHDEAMAEVDRITTASGAAAATEGSSRTGSPPVLGWEALRALAREGVTLAPHTRTHPLLDRVPVETAVAEIRGSLDDLEREVGPTPHVLAYPSGAHGGDAVEAARRAGMVLAVTTERGGNDLRRADPLRLRRINIGLRTHAPLVRGQLLWASTVGARRR